MQGPDTETAARIIAENVISAFEREREGAGGFIGSGRDMALAGLMRELLGVMPTDDSDVLAAACNRFLDRLATMSMPGPRVEAIDPDDGSVTMTAA
ncbi:hypothetical protein ACQKQD_18405 [Methylobacterium sp. NPDC080182]|uniref:hypothetical protein n=1 Tax=Methylobacterium sp. NPDC080182 TaxID=3390590 RepID=UPI003CFF4948